MTNQQNTGFEMKTSTGHAAADGVHLDHHFEFMRPEYEAMLAAAGIHSGWRVLDAGAGGGSFLPLIDERLGKSGHIDALDLAPENVDMIQRRIDAGHFGCSIEAKIGTVFELPYADGLFDLTWCANVTQYLTDKELTQAMAEMRRVTKPGGYVVIKEVDMTACRQWAPCDPAVLWRFLTAVRPMTQVEGILRTANLPKWMREAGLSFVNYETFHGERRPPFTKDEFDFVGTVLTFFGSTAVTLDLPKADLDQWKRMIDPEATDYILKDPDFYWRESMALIIGQVPA